MTDLRLCDEAMQLDLAAFVEEWLASDPERTSQVLFEGKSPGRPIDGKLHWTREFFATGFEVDAERDTVDYRRRLDERSVKQDELLCTISEPVDGEPGLDVYGQPIRGAKAKRAKIRVGPNVTTSDGREYFAATDGRIRWHRGMLSVDDVYVVDGNVDIRTGNIRHLGTLVVHGDVGRDSQVYAEKDVDVRGTIDGGTVHAGGDITVHGGIVGHDGSVVEAGGAVRAAYILDARVHSKSDILVGREIVQSHVSAQGRVHLSQGRIVGGITQAGIEIIAGEVGTEAAVKTALHVSEPDVIVAERTKLESLLKTLDERYKQIELVVSKLKQQSANLSPEKRNALDKLTAQLAEIESEREACREEIEALAAQLPPADSRFVRVLRQLHSESTINIDGLMKTVTHSIAGPLTIRERGGEVRIFGD
jgi:hypothetical protein